MNQMQDVQVVAQRVQQTTINHDVVGNDRLNRENTGQNLPYLLSTIPAIQVTSDDGLGVGYTYFRVRGTDHTRINMTVNDVPLNDQESQTVFWVNMTDMAASMSSIDVQRGVGTSTNGSASFGASLNMYTGNTDTANHFTLAFNGGMYNTFREMVSGHVVLPGNWRVNARFSKVNSDGFLYRTNSDLYSYYGDLGWYGDKTQVVARFFGGKEKTGMGWDGVDYNTAYGIDGADRRYNPAGEYTDAEGNTKYYDNQTDNYAQQHAQLQITHRFTPNWSLNATLHYTHGGGYYEQYKRKSFEYWGLNRYTDVNGEKVKKAYGMYRKSLDNHFAGAIVSAKYVNEHVDVQVFVFLYRASEIAVGDDTHALLSVIDHGHAEVFLRHLADEFAEGCRYLHAGNALLHSVLHPCEQASSERSARVIDGEVLRLEMSFLHEADGQRVSHERRRGSRCGRCQPERACLFVHMDRKGQVRLLRQRGFYVSRHGDNATTDITERSNHIEYLVGAAAIAHQHHHIFSAHHAQIAVHCLDSVHKDG